VNSGSEAGRQAEAARRVNDLRLSARRRSGLARGGKGKGHECQS
jgi:hypothetical protein